VRDTPDVTVSNELTGEVGTSVQAGSINGDVVVQHRCATHLAVYLHAAEALGSQALVTQVGALSALTQLVRSHVDMTESVVQLLNAWVATRTDFENPTPESRIRFGALGQVLVHCLHNRYRHDLDSWAGTTGQVTREITVGGRGARKQIRMTITTTW
jgi:hypothetical protein